MVSQLWLLLYMWPNLVYWYQHPPPGSASLRFQNAIRGTLAEVEYLGQVHPALEKRVQCTVRFFFFKFLGSYPPVNGPKDPWPRVLSLPGAQVVCWRPHPAGKWQYMNHVSIVTWFHISYTQKKRVPKQCPWGAIATNSVLHHSRRCRRCDFMLGC